MLNHGRVVIVFILSFGLAFGADVRATVDTVEVVKGNPVTLRIKATGGSAAFPKILMVADAVVTGTSTSSSRNLSMANGSVTTEASTTKVIQFVPKQDMIVPSYTVNISGKSYKTDPIAIKVVKSNASSTNSAALFNLTMKSSKAKVQVGESFLLTVYFSLRNNVRLSQEVQYTSPDLAHFIVTKTDEKNAYIKGNYQIQEIQYIVTALKEGNFSISPAGAKVGIPDGNRRDIFGMSFGTKWYQGASNTLDIEVVPQSIEADIIGDFKVTSIIDTQKVKANKPANLTVTIEGKGNLENFEFPPYEIDNVTIYSDDAKVDMKVVDGELYSIYSKKFAFISDVDFSIPKRNFTMLNNISDTVQELNVQGYDIHIKHTVSTLTSAAGSQGTVQTKLEQAIKTKETIVEKEVEVKTVAWWMLALAFVAGGLLTYILRFIPKRNTKPYKESEALKILYSHISDDPEVEEMVHKLYAKKNGDKSVQIDKKRLKVLVERFG